MKTLTAVLAVALAVMVMAPTLAVAGDYPEPAKMTHWVTGSVGSVDPNAKTFTLTTDKARQGTKAYTFTVSDPKLLTDLKTGDRVRVGYATRHNQMVAAEITPQSTASRR
jgi:Cu/Ag efflux protein CusF